MQQTQLDQFFLIKKNTENHTFKTTSQKLRSSESETHEKIRTKKASQKSQQIVSSKRTNINLDTSTKSNRKNRKVVTDQSEFVKNDNEIRSLKFLNQNETILPDNKNDKIKELSGLNSQLFTQYQNQSPSKHSKKSVYKSDTLNLTPKKSPLQQGKSTSPKNVSVSPKTGKFSPKRSLRVKRSLSFNSKIQSPRKFFKMTVDEQTTLSCIEHLNLAKQGAITATRFNLDKIYACKYFQFEYSRLNSMATVKYEINDLVIPNETYSRYLFMIIINVFSSPVNCSYFDEDELDCVYTVLSLPSKAQQLFARMYKRQHSWHRASNIKYTDISEDLIPIFSILVKESLFTSDIETEKLSIMLELMCVDEVRKICQDIKIDSHGKKHVLIERITKLYNTKKPLFPGMKGPDHALRILISKKLGYCICLTSKIITTFDKIITLLMPNQDPDKSITDLFLMLMQVEQGLIKFPALPTSRYPIFCDKMQLLNYIKAKNALCEILSAIEKKKWTLVEKIGNIAYDKLSTTLQIERKSLMNSSLPLHVKRFMPGYIWLKVLSKSVDAFKKSAGTIPRAVEILNLLINQNCYMERRKAKWSADLALIEMHHKKDLEKSAAITLQTLQKENLTDCDRLDLLERARKLIKRKVGISKDTKVNVQAMFQSMQSRLPTLSPVYTTIKATLVSGTVGITQRKSRWCISIDSDNQYYGSVEDVVLHMYHFQGFNGIHCEGALPITIFSILFWEEIYNIDVPGAFVSVYQNAPLDLYTEEFYRNRQQNIDRKLQNILMLNVEELSTLVENNFICYQEYVSIMHAALFNNISIKEIILCLGVKAVIGICERLIYNYNLWKAGFPDLILWNIKERKCKIVEVKGPGDKLSTKQELWIQYLDQLQIDTEVCSVQDNGNVKKGRI